MEDFDKYKEALNRAKKLYEKGTITESLNYIFPELKESEDEESKKWILEYLYDGLRKSDDQFKGQFKCAIAWLEKQKAIDVLDAEEREFADNVNSYRKDMDEFYKKGYDAGREAEKQYWLGKQDEQKDYVVDVVEPKFHERDWAVSNLDRKARQISEVHFDEYNSYYVVDGKSVNLEEYDRLHYLWSIEDAKDGDVLASGQVVFMFKMIHGVWLNCHCSLHNDGSFIAESYDLVTDKYFSEVHPATKEQRELLFQKMKEAGYEWDSENKKLNNIELNSFEGDIVEKAIRKAGYEWSEDTHQLKKIDPKFKVGDWVVQGCNILNIRCVGDKYYCFETVGGYVDDMLVSEIDSLYHLWTIADAKDGDVLYSKKHNLIWIYKDNKHYYASINLNYADVVSFDNEIVIPSDVCPANRVQKSILFQKMGESGCVWDEKNKELKLPVTNGGDF